MFFVTHSDQRRDHNEPLEAQSPSRLLNADCGRSVPVKSFSLILINICRPGDFGIFGKYLLALTDSDTHFF